MSTRSRVVFILVVALAGLVAVLGGLALDASGRIKAREAAEKAAAEAAAARPLGRGIIAGSPAIGGPFTLVDHDGRQVTHATFRGKYLLVFFGFTNCPDVCPLALDRFAQVMDTLGPDAERVQPLLVSVDPERDTPAVLKQYVTALHPRIIGLTGTPEQVKAAASAYKVYFAKAPQGGAGGYTMDHSAFEYLMGPNGQNLYVFRSEAEPERLAELIRGALRS